MELYCSASPMASALPHAAKPAFCLSSSNSVLFGNGARSFSRGSVSMFSRRWTPRKATRRPGECRCLFGLGVPELVVIAGVAALVFGPKKLPEIGKNIGKTVKSFQQAAKEFETELKEKPEAEAASSVEKPNAVGGENGEKKLGTTPSKESM